VRSFDQRRGLGEIVSEDGTVFAFHASAIVDGSRKIAAGTPVDFDVEAGLLGRWEAARIEKRAG
jgi:cold shock CspA family protein